MSRVGKTFISDSGTKATVVWEDEQSVVYNFVPKDNPNKLYRSVSDPVNFERGYPKEYVKPRTLKRWMVVYIVSGVLYTTTRTSKEDAERFNTYPIIDIMEIDWTEKV